MSLPPPAGSSGKPAPGTPTNPSSLPLEGSRSTGQGLLISTTPDVCLTPVGDTVVPVPYNIYAYQSDDANTATSVLLTSQRTHTAKSLITKCYGDEKGIRGGVHSGTHNSICEPKTWSPSVRFEGYGVVRHQDEWWMNKRNTVGKLSYTKDAHGYQPVYYATGANNVEVPESGEQPQPTKATAKDGAITMRDIEPQGVRLDPWTKLAFAEVEPAVRPPIEVPAFRPPPVRPPSGPPIRPPGVPGGGVRPGGVGVDPTQELLPNVPVGIPDRTDRLTDPDKKEFIAPSCLEPYFYQAPGLNAPGATTDLGGNIHITTHYPAPLDKVMMIPLGSSGSYVYVPSQPITNSWGEYLFGTHLSFQEMEELCKKQRAQGNVRASGDEDKKRCPCTVGPYKELRYTCPLVCPNSQAHHIVPDMFLRMGTRKEAVKATGGQDRIPPPEGSKPFPSFLDGPAICLEGNARTTGTEHNTGHEVDKKVVAAGAKEDNCGTLPIGYVLTESVSSAIAARKDCADKIRAAVGVAFEGVSPDALCRATIGPVESGSPQFDKLNAPKPEKEF